ncbi:MAG: damage-control phosphatase ARMT1 family protein [Armatimonadota bacterium]|nr:damage-control phosphatase ARMT1 family protein [Armatimonadota bacterium]MDR7439296.1 damage-control phosphatase ARMT1 family protein [Armatimonadota bacterium]MDR7562073.1 damage-control phosphatase ARMT1 family protein [Armatimonadota bacterium]MDR7568017.1 damage-control phosphatase ARMT1 family protein [Armatimonadota bacterium]MDR7601100.1 damage-control phosphatase ARMT1 family protein [Armatimonadota bacterium]
MGIGPFDLPRPRIDLRSLPPPLRTSDPGSLAQRTFRVRIPGIVEEVATWNPFPPEIRAELERLREEVLHGTIRPLVEPAPDRSLWDALSAPYVGRSWQDVPWYWAEAFSYRRLLEATRYFRPGPWYGVDPFWGMKRAELARGVSDVAVLLRALPEDPAVRLRTLLYASLWGNRFDLSLPEVAKGTRFAFDPRGGLLVDDTESVWAFLAGSRGLRIAVAVDNAGPELLADLALVDFLLERGIAEEVVLHVKWHPFFVSDATPQDVLATLETLVEGRGRVMGLGERLRAFARSGRVRWAAHWFFVTSLAYYEMPLDLEADLATCQLVILKGDANYRRLVGDVWWPPTTPLEATTAYFPAPFVVLRTLKSEVVVGLEGAMVDRVCQLDPAWRVGGRWGVIQARLAPPLPPRPDS